MIHCRNCIHWVDESLKEIEADDRTGHIYMGCRIFGFVEGASKEDCPRYQESEDLYALCGSCRKIVPKLCISLGECVNCTDTDLYCLDHCSGGESRKYCTHFARLYSQGVQLIDPDKHVFDLYPTLDMPGRKRKGK